MKKLTTTKYVVDEWQCWKGEEAPYWYIGETSSDTYLAMTYTERNARLITAAPELRELVQKLAELPVTDSVAGYLMAPMIYEARSLLDCIDGEEAAHEGTD